MTLSRPRRLSLRFGVLFYLSALLLLPIGMIIYRTFEAGFVGSFEVVFSDHGIEALKLSLLTVAIAVPANTIFGVLAAIVIVRQKWPGRRLFNTLLDIPFAISPVVIGLSLLLLYGPRESVGSFLLDNGIRVVFSTPGIVIACIFVSLPFVVREVIPVLQEVGDEQEQAAETLGANWWQTFWRITLPSIRWAVTYGVVISTARVLGEFGAVYVVSGRISGQTETLPLFVRDQFEVLNSGAGYAAALLLAAVALVVLVAMNLANRRKEA